MKKRFLAILMIILMIFVLASCDDPEDVLDTGERISGTYVWSVGSFGEDSWSFNDNQVINRSSNGLEYVEQAYNYVIGIKDGTKIIKLTELDGFSYIEYEFNYGNGYVMIAGTRYEITEE